MYLNKNKKFGYLSNKNSKLQLCNLSLKKKNIFLKPKKFGFFFFKRLNYVYSWVTLNKFNFLNVFNTGSVTKTAVIKNKNFLKYVHFVWLKFINKNLIKFWNLQAYYFFKESIPILKSNKVIKNNKKQKNILYLKKFLYLKNVHNCVISTKKQKNNCNIFLLKKKKKIILNKKVNKILYITNNKFKLFYKTFSKNLCLVPPTLNLVQNTLKRTTFLAFTYSYGNLPVTFKPLVITSTLPLLYSKILNIATNKQIIVSNRLNVMLLGHNAFHNVCYLQNFKSKFFFIQCNKIFFKNLLHLKITFNTTYRAQLFFKNKQYIKNKKKKIKRYQQWKINRFYSYIIKNNKNFFFSYYMKPYINKYLRFKFKFKIFKKTLRFVNKLYYLHLFLTSKKLKYLRKLFDTYNIYKKVFLRCIAQSVCESPVFMHTKKSINIINLNKFYLLYAGHLYNYKKFNFFLGAFPSLNNKLLSFKQTALYLRYVILSIKLTNSKNYNSNTKIMVPKLKKNINLKLKRKLYLLNLFKFFKLKRFFFFNITLSFFWKKRSIDYTCAYLLKKYRYFSSYQNKNILKKNYNFEVIIKLLKNSNSTGSTPFVVNTIFMYKQTSNFFFKYKYYNILKKQQILEHSFLYKNNYLSWNFFYFWYWYVFSYISIYFQKAGNFFFSNDEFLFEDNITSKKTSQFYLMAPWQSSNIDKSFIADKRNLFYLKKKTLHKNYQVYFNFFFQIILKYILLKNSKLYKRIYALQLTKWKKHFQIFKKVYKNFSSKLYKRSLLSKHKTKLSRKLNLRLKTNIRKLNITSLNFFNTCGYYSYFKRKLFKKKRIYAFFLSFFKKQEKMYKNVQKNALNISDKIGIINVVTYFNNTYVTLTDLYGNVLFVRSGGLVGIKGPNRATSVTSEEVTLAVCSFLKKTSLKFLILKFSGVLYSRKIKAAFKVFTFQKNYKILRVFNNTPKAHNGIRLKKKKRL